MQAKVQDRPPTTAPRAKCEVIGSLLRPPYLADARRRYEQTEISMPEFKRLEDRAVDEAVETQTQAWIDVITDGEMRRYAFYGHLIDSLETNSPPRNREVEAEKAKVRAIARFG